MPNDSKYFKEEREQLLDSLSDSDSDNDEQPSSSTQRDDELELEPRNAEEEEERAIQLQPEFEYVRPPTPSPWKRAALILFIISLFWLAYKMQAWKREPKNVVYASRYSKQHKFRPAASPIITETLADGKTRIRGANPLATHYPTATPTPAKATNKRKKARAGGKRKTTTNKKTPKKTHATKRR